MNTPSLFWSPKNDPDISPDNTGRDPLGLQPIWSGAGRMITPHFASGISRYEGLLAVLLGYEIAAKLSLNLKQTRNFFYTWEALVETQWYCSDNRHVLYGQRFFANGLDNENLNPKSQKNALTFRKGLWLFYRGTLRRMKLLNKNLKLDSDNKIEWPDDALQQLVIFFERHFINKEAIKLIDASTQLDKVLEQCWQHKKALECLMSHLYHKDESNELCYEWALACQQLDASVDGSSWRKVANNILEIPDGNTPILKRRLTLLNKIDPWLAILDAIVNWLDGQDQSNIKDLEKHLSQFGKQAVVREAAQKFPTIIEIEDEIRIKDIGSISSNMNKRWIVLTELATCFLDQKWAEFVQRLVNYHHNITVPERRRWHLDSNQLLCNLARQNNPLDLDVKASSLKYQSYYLHAAKQIHQQLSGALA